MFKNYDLKRIPYRLLFYVFCITIMGIAVVGSAKSSVQDKQILGMILGIVALIIIGSINYTFILKFRWLIYIGNIGLLILVRVFGDTSLGAKRWIEIAGIRFQPSEVSKICIILFFAYFFAKRKENINSIKTIVLSGILIFIPWYMVMDQPDLSTSIVVALIFLAILFLAGLSYKIILSVLGVAIPAIVVFIVLILQPDQKILEHYQYIRVMAWLQPEKYANNAYQQQNAIMAIGSGQMWGKGLYNDTALSVKNGNFIPEPQTDFIFAVVAEELGFFGAFILLLLLLLIVVECIMIGNKAKDFFGKLICGGVAAWIGFQSFINICVVTGLMPNTGLTLPFVSYGLTSLVCLFAAIGFVTNVAIQPKKYRSGDELI